MRHILRPLFDRVVVKELEPDRIRQSGLLVPAGTHEPPPQHGIVLAVGPGLDWWEQAGIAMPVKPGDHVVFPAAAGRLGRGRRGAPARLPRRRAARRARDRVRERRGVRQLADGLWYWTARHPEWHPGEFGAQVGCYLAHEGGRTIIIDPLATEDLDAYIDGDVVVAVTIPYHVRDSAELAKRYGGVVSAHPDARRRLPDGTPFDPDAGLRWHALKRGKERPLELPGHRALVFGDRIVGVDGGLRYWINNPSPTSARTSSAASRPRSSRTCSRSTSTARSSPTASRS